MSDTAAIVLAYIAITSVLLLNGRIAYRQGHRHGHELAALEAVERGVQWRVASESQRDIAWSKTTAVGAASHCTVAVGLVLPDGVTGALLDCVECGAVHEVGNVTDQRAWQYIAEVRTTDKERDDVA